MPSAQKPLLNCAGRVHASPVAMVGMQTSAHAHDGAPAAPAGVAEQTPSAPGRLQRSQALSQADWQQTPSTQKPERQVPASAQGWPLQPRQIGGASGGLFFEQAAARSASAAAA